jgi:hypothetical protein
MSTHAHWERDYSGSSDPLKEFVLAWVLALVALVVMSVALPSQGPLAPRPGASVAKADESGWAVVEVTAAQR